jgi:hypothetical protein
VLPGEPNAMKNRASLIFLMLKETYISYTGGKKTVNGILN